MKSECLARNVKVKEGRKGLHAASQPHHILRTKDAAVIDGIQINFPCKSCFLIVSISSFKKIRRTVIIYSRHCATSPKDAVSIFDGVIRIFFLELTFPAALWTCGLFSF